MGGIGIKETVEVVDATGELGALIVKHLKDGFQPAGDLAAIGTEIMLKPDVQAVLKRAAEGIQNVPAEIKDVDLGEGLELAEVSLRNTKKVLASLK